MSKSTEASSRRLSEPNGKNPLSSLASPRKTVKSTAFMLASGLAISAIICTMPATNNKVLTVSMEDNLYRASSVEFVETAEIEPMYGLYFAQAEDETKKETDFSVYTTSLTQQEKHNLLYPAQQEEEEEVVTTGKNFVKFENAKDSGNYIRFNGNAIPMSEMVIPDYITFDENGLPTNYEYCIEGKSTAYYGGTRTATGTTPRQGSVAVDPRLIPYGTEMWIVSLDGSHVYGYCRAEDTGGFIYFRNGALVDLYMHSYDDCCNWGWRGVRVYILKTK